MNSAVSQAEAEHINKKVEESLPDNWHDDWLTFWRSKSQRELSKEAEVHLATLKEEQKEGLGKIVQMEEVYDNSFSKMKQIRTDLENKRIEIDEILGKKYTTQEDVDGANARLKIIKGEKLYKNV